MLCGALPSASLALTGRIKKYHTNLLLGKKRMEDHRVSPHLPDPEAPRLNQHAQSPSSSPFRVIQSETTSPSPEPSPALEEAEPTVFISIERLRELEAIEKRIPTLIEKAIQDHKKEKLKLLHERDKLDPSLVNLRVKRYAMKHKDEINAKRRAKRKESAAGAARSVSATSVVTQSTVEDPSAVGSAAYRRTLSTLTVSFDE